MRVRDMAILWALFGAVCGAAPELARGGNLIGLISFALAGVIVTPTLGVFIALLGGRVKPSLLGALWGAAMGALAGSLGMGSASYALTVGLLVGAMAGGTLPQIVRSMSFLARSVLSLRRAR
jgi:hypothetical protein